MVTETLVEVKRDFRNTFPDEESLGVDSVGHYNVYLLLTRRTDDLVFSMFRIDRRQVFPVHGSHLFGNEKFENVKLH